MTVIKNGECYDVIQCKTCGFIRKRHGLEESPLGIVCYPETTCTDCNRIFKTQKGHDNHKEKNKHKTPEWLPDGV